MIMFKCADCGAEFHFPIFAEEHDPNYEGGTYVSRSCPKCGSNEMDEGLECEICGDWSEYGLCDHCAEDLENRFSTVLHENFNEDEIEALNKIYDGRDIG